MHALRQPGTSGSILSHVIGLQKRAKTSNFVRDHRIKGDSYAAFTRSLFPFEDDLRTKARLSHMGASSSRNTACLPRQVFQALAAETCFRPRPVFKDSPPGGRMFGFLDVQQEIYP